MQTNYRSQSLDHLADIPHHYKSKLVFNISLFLENISLAGAERFSGSVSKLLVSSPSLNRLDLGLSAIMGHRFLDDQQSWNTTGMSKKKFCNGFSSCGTVFPVGIFVKRESP